MILFSIALPGWFADWCDAVLTRLAHELGGSVVYASWPPLTQLFGFEPFGSTLDQLGSVLAGTDAEHVVFGVRHPDERLRAALIETNTRFLLTVADPCETALSTLAQGIGDPRGIIRAIANSCAFLDQYRELPDALALDATGADAGSAELVEAIAAHFGIPVTPEIVASVVWDLEFRDLRSRPQAGEDAPGSAGLIKTVNGALEAYRRHFRGERLQEILWTRDLFLTMSGPAIGPVDAAGAGAGRVIIFGPYIHLLPGSWTARVLLGFSEEAVGHIFMVDAFATDRQLASVSFQPLVAGPYTTEISFSLSDFIGLGLEIRVLVMSENARGSIAFGQATLMPMGLLSGASAQQTGADFRAVLDV